MDAVKSMQDLQDREVNILFFIRRSYFALLSLFRGRNAAQAVDNKGTPAMARPGGGGGSRGGPRATYVYVGNIPSVGGNGCGL